MNIPDRKSRAELLCDEIRLLHSTHEDLSIYVLIYGVAYPLLYEQLAEQLKGQDFVRMVQIFDARGDDPLEQYGPFLFHIPKDTDGDLLRLLTSLCTSDPRGMSFLLSRLSILTLKTCLQSRLAVRCEDGTEWQLKYFDSRTLPVLTRALTTLQFEQFFSIVLEWWFLDREGELRSLAGTDDASDSYKPPLLLSELQATVFTDAAIPDSILHILEITDDDLTGAFSPQARYQIIAKALAGATPEERNSAPMLADRARLALLEALKLQDRA
ncbi:DUF4123 domain-containing protein [Paraburkholderia nemoris]|uniref:DUF4123 domain-containing protein n=1 Tax=Paraburkholderia nemoris TaxID=2793076 RepID=UPI001AFE21E1|nr:DUF4123 domain-containing protein [Paraburkholderia nemoris]CAE6792311.1 hypothetical protein LMG22931_05013 [Paraburkholderia nemoris]